MVYYGGTLIDNNVFLNMEDEELIIRNLSFESYVIISYGIGHLLMPVSSININRWAF